MKKLFILFALLMLGVSTELRAETSTSTSSGTRYYENQVYITAYNDSGAAISSNQVVILDTTETAGTTLGAYVTRTTTANDSRVVGVTHDSIPDGQAGAVCVRGPHRVMVVNTDAGAVAQYSVGASMSTTTTTGRVSIITANNNPGAIVGRLMSTTADSSSPELYWIWVK